MVSERRIGLPSAVGIGMGSMLGAGVFAVWAPAVAAAGSWLLVAVALAAVVAVINALSTAQLAAFHPVAGGAYTYGRRELSEAWGFVAGLGFVVGKTASVAAMGLAIGAYVWPSQAPVVASVAVVGAWALNASGVQRTARAAIVIAAAVVAGLVAVAIGSLTQPAAVAVAQESAASPLGGPVLGTVTGIGAAAGLMFFAFAGYARLATLGEEVKSPATVIPRAIGIAVASAVVLYLGLAAVLMRRPGPDALAHADAPLVLAAPQGAAWTVLLAVLAVLAAGGAMVALMAGIGRTAMAMAREGDLPTALAHQSSRHVPWRAEGLAGVVAIGLAWWGDLAFALSMSAVAVLIYYAVANGAAAKAVGRGNVAGFAVPRRVSQAGVLLCVAVALSLDLVPTLAALGLALVAVFARWVMRTREAIRQADLERQREE